MDFGQALLIGGISICRKFSHFVITLWSLGVYAICLNDRIVYALKFLEDN